VRGNPQKRSIFLTGNNAVVNFTTVLSYMGNSPMRDNNPRSRVSTRLGFAKSEDFTIKLDPAKQCLIDKIANRDLKMM